MFLLSRLTVAALLLSTSAFASSPPTVNTTRGSVVGKIIGVSSDDGVFPTYVEAKAFLGIPFATAPTGGLRFRKTIRLEKYLSDPYDATSAKPMCAQPPMPGGGPQETQSEDCLYLNIYTPTEMPEEGVLNQYIANDIIYVSIQYRLGVQGFFTTNTTAFAPHRGFFDQIEALKFVQEEIASFGGDPNRVTISGYSAGSLSVHALTLSEQARGLFQQVIMSSGSVSLQWEGSAPDCPSNELIASIVRATELKNALQFCNTTLDNEAVLVPCMYSMTANQFNTHIQEIQDKLGYPINFKLQLDGDFFTKRPSELVNSRPNLPTIIGDTNAEESFGFLQPVQMGVQNLTTFNEAFFNQVFQTQLPRIANNSAALAFLKSKYFPDGILANDWLNWLIGTTMVSQAQNNRSFQALDATKFIAPALREVHDQVRNGNGQQLYVYQSRYSTPLTRPLPVTGWDPAPVRHGGDIDLWQLNRDRWNGTASSTDLLVAQFYGQLISNFVTTGNPGFGWLAGDYTSGHVPYFEINTIETSTMRDDLYPVDQMVWNEPNGILRILNLTIFPPTY